MVSPEPALDLVQELDSARGLEAAPEIQIVQIGLTRSLLEVVAQVAQLLLGDQDHFLAPHFPAQVLQTGPNRDVLGVEDRSLDGNQAVELAGHVADESVLVLLQPVDFRVLRKPLDELRKDLLESLLDFGLLGLGRQLLEV